MSASTTATLLPAPTRPGDRLWPIATVMATAIFATTFVQTQSLGSLPLNHLLKMQGLDSDRAATFFSLAIIPWSFKTVAGLLVDGVPLFGSRRKSYLALSALTSAALWLMMGLAPVNFTLLLVLAIILNAAIVFGSTTAGGLLVEAGQKFNMSGRLSSLRVLAQNLGAGLSSPVAGLLAAHTMRGNHPLFWTSVVAGVPLLCMLLFALFVLEETSVVRPNHGRSWGAQAVHVLRSVWGQIRNVLRVQMLLPAALLFFIQAVPTFRSTCFYQYQTGDLHYDDEQLGWLGLAGYLMALASSGVYVWWCRKAALRTSLYGAVILTALSALPYLFYKAYEPYMVRAITIEGVGTFLQILAYLPLFDLAVRCTPKGSEALGYSVLIGVWNIGLMIGGKAGPKLYEHVLDKNMSSLIWLNAGVTLAGVGLVFLLPRKLVDQSEGK